jgi:signal transduction histidine kinase
MAKRSRPGRSPTPAAAAEGKRVRTRFERLLEATIAMGLSGSLEELLQRLVDSARDVVGARFAAIGVLSPDGGALAAFVTSGLSVIERARIGDLPRGRGLLGLLISDPRPIRTKDISRHPQRFGFPAHHPAMTSFLGVPVRGREKVFGNLYLTDKQGADEFSAEDEAIAVALAAQAAVAVEKQRLYEGSQELLGRVRGMQRQRDLFFAMMNHELRNALTGVFGWAERLVRVKSSDGVERAAREVYEGAERTITLLNNFLDLTRLDAGKVRPVWRDIELEPALARVLSGIEPAATARRISLELDRRGGSMLRTDPVRLEQILVNLLSNAVRHSPEGGTVAVRVAPEPDGLAFRVVDRGPGVPPDLRERIFEPFERFDPHSGLGTGLGLPVSRRLAEVLGGTLLVETTVGGGATFVLTLPVAPPA